MSDYDQGDVTLQTACKLLGGEVPYSEITVRRMIRDGAIAAYGRGVLLRVSVASIAAYKRGERTWQRSARENRADRAGAARSSGSGTGRTSPAQLTVLDQDGSRLDRKATVKPKKP